MTDTTREHTAPTGATAHDRRTPAAAAPPRPHPGSPTPAAPAADGPTAAPTVPRPRRSPDAPADPGTATPPGPGPAAPRRTASLGRRGSRRPNGPAGRGPGASGNRGPTRTPHLARTATERRPAHPGGTAPAPLPTPGAQRRAHENRPHFWFAHQLLLTLSGQRPVHALLGHTLPAAYDRLAELAPLSPLRPYVAPGLRAPVPALHACGLCRPGEGIIEAFARITTGARLRALAFRLERGADARWRCAALDIGPLP
ncbi:Rv3235 family protein [Streptomyces sp. NPDC093707]|uniref:Rv3235 family protein n=1 Tax=Streptomyces sp. NPDC093707 TaxID=3154984 RepID=UPI00344BBE93